MNIIKKLSTLKWSGFSRINFRNQLSLLAGGLLCISLMLGTLLASQEILRASNQQADNLGKTLIAQTVLSVRDIVVTGDRLSLNVFLRQLTQNPNIARATLYSVDNSPVSSVEASGYKSDKSYSLYTAPINYQNVIVGRISLEIDTDSLSGPGLRAVFLFFSVSLLLGLGGTFLVWTYAGHRQHSLSRAIWQLQGLTQNHRAFDPEVKDEIKQLAQQLEYLITRKTDTLQPPVQPPRAVPARDEDHPKEPDTEPEQEKVLLVMRISNLNQLMKHLPQPRLLDLLEHKLPLMTKATHLYGGELHFSAEGNAYIHFSNDSSGEDFIFRAICCALLVQKLLTTQNEGDIAALEVDAAISTLSPVMPGEHHPALADSAAGQALMMASLGHGKLLTDIPEEAMFNSQYTLLETEFGGDILRVGPLPEQCQLLLDRQAEQIFDNQNI